MCMCYVFSYVCVCAHVHLRMCVHVQVCVHTCIRNLEIKLRFHFSRPTRLKTLRQGLSLGPVVR